MVCLTFYALQVVLPLVSTRNFCCEYWVAWKISSRLKEAGWSTSLRSRHWHSCQFSLASCSWAHQFQTGGPCIPISARHCTSIPVWPSPPRCWLAVSSSSTVGDFQPTWYPPVASRNCLSKTVHLALLGQSSATVSLMTLHRPHRCQFSERNWKLNLFQQSYPDVIL